MRKKSRKNEVNYNPTLQFRPGPAMGRRVAEFADRWGVGWNEATRRLAALAACGLTPKYSPPVERLAEYLGGVNEFFQAADRVQIVLQSVDDTRAKLVQPPMSEAEHLAYVDDWVSSFVAADSRQGLDTPAGLPAGDADAAQAASEAPPTDKRERAIREPLNKDLEGRAEGTPKHGNTKEES
jgi:hypothetical protein